jgi:hypothetical protein
MTWCLPLRGCGCDRFPSARRMLATKPGSASWSTRSRTLAAISSTLAAISSTLGAISTVEFGYRRAARRPIRHGELRTDLDLLEVAEWLALIQFILVGRLDFSRPHDPGHRKLLKTFVLQAFLSVGVTEARVERPLPRACAVVQPAQRADMLARG